MRLFHWCLPFLCLLILHNEIAGASPDERQRKGAKGRQGPKKDNDIGFIDDRLPIVVVSPKRCWSREGYSVFSRDVENRLGQYVKELNKEEDAARELTLSHGKPLIPIDIEGARYYALNRQGGVLYLLQNAFAEIRLSGTVFKNGTVIDQGRSLSEMGIDVHSPPFVSAEQTRHGQLKRWLQDLEEGNGIDISGTNLFQLMSSPVYGDTYVPLSPVDDTLILAVGKPNHDISIQFEYQGIKFTKLLLFLVGATLLKYAPMLSSNFAFQLATESLLGTLVGFIVLGILIWRKTTLKNSMAFGFVSLMGSMIPTMYGKWGNIIAALWSMTWAQWLIAYAVPLFVFLFIFFYIWGPITEKRPLQVISVTLRIIAISLMRLQTTSTTAFLCLLSLLPLMKTFWLLIGAIFWYIRQKLEWVYRYLPSRLMRKSRRTLSDAEYKQHVAIATQVGLKDLRNKIKEDFGEWFTRLPEDAGVEAFTFAFFGEDDVSPSLRMERSDIKVDAEGRRTDPREEDDDDDQDEDEVIRAMEDFQDLAEARSRTPRRYPTADRVRSLHHLLQTSERKQNHHQSRSFTPSRRKLRRRMSFSRRPGPTTPPANEVEHASDTEGSGNGST